MAWVNSEYALGAADAPAAKCLIYLGRCRSQSSVAILAHSRADANTVAILAAHRTDAYNTVTFVVHRTDASSSAAAASKTQLCRCRQQLCRYRQRHSGQGELEQLYRCRQGELEQLSLCRCRQQDVGQQRLALERLYRWR